MTKTFKTTLLFFITAFVFSCSQILQSVDLDINTEDDSVQEKFDVIEKTLTVEEARRQKNATYPRTVLRNGRGEKAQPIPEKFALRSEFPENETPPEYKIGIGDTITLSRLVENNRSIDKKANKWPPQTLESKYKLGVGDTLTLTLIRKDDNLNTIPAGGDENGQNLIINSQQEDITIKSTGRIGSDGSLLLLEVGRLEADNKSLNELRSEVRNILIRNGVSPRFQLEISDFKSQRAYLTISPSQGVASSLINLKDQKTTLLDILTSAQISFQPGFITIVKLKRKDSMFIMRLRDIFDKSSPEISILDRDHIFVEETSAEKLLSVSEVDQDGTVVFEGVGK